MKRKLIDIKESSFEVLSAEATAKSTNLKNYIEDLLDQKAKYLEESGVALYRFSSLEEPSDSQLSVIMEKSAEAAVNKKTLTMSAFFSNLEQLVESVQ